MPIWAAPLLSSPIPVVIDNDIIGPQTSAISKALPI
jgi:hypothetical protein